MRGYSEWSDSNNSDLLVARSQVERVLSQIGVQSRVRGGFSIDELAGSIAYRLHLPENQVVDILSTPNISTYPDVWCMLPLFIENGSIPVAWTQGELRKPDLQVEVYEGYQALKFRRSGVLDIMQMQPMTDRLGFGYMMGGYSKCTSEIMEKIATAARQSGMQVAITDDLLCNLKEARNIFAQNDIVPELNLIDRDVQVSEVHPDECAIHHISSLFELSQSPRIHMLDGDRTLLNTNGSKEDMCDRLVACVMDK